MSVRTILVIVLLLTSHQTKTAIAYEALPVEQRSSTTGYPTGTSSYYIAYKDVRDDIPTKKVESASPIKPTDTFDIKAQFTSAGGLAYDGEYLWVSSQSVRDPDQLLQFSTRGELLTRFKIKNAGNIGGGMTFDGVHLYILDYANRIASNDGIRITGNGEIFRVEANKTLTPYLRLPRDQFNTFGIAYHQGSLYYGHSPTVRDRGSIFKVTVENVSLKEADLGFYINSLASDGRSLWASTEGSIVNMDAEYKIIRTIKTPFTIKAIAWVGKDLWAIEKNANRLHRFSELGKRN